MTHFSDRLARRALTAQGYYTTSRVRCAARFARLTGCSIHEAATTFGLNAGAVWNAWSRLYPTRPHPIAADRRQSTCTACGRCGHLAVRGRCSPTQLALELIADGATVIEAADQFGLNRKSVYAARSERRRAA